MAKVDTSLFLNNGREYVIGGQKVILTPLTGKHLDLFSDSDENDVQGMKKLVSAVFELSMDEVDKCPLPQLKEMFDASMDVNGLKKSK